MKTIFCFIFCIGAFYTDYKVESFTIKVTSLLPAPETPVETEEGEVYRNEKYNSDVTPFTTTINDEISEDNDIDLHFEYFCDFNEDSYLVAEGITTLCSADYEDFDGTVAALVLEALGIGKNSLCPVEPGTYKQESTFYLENGEFGGLFDDSYRKSIKLRITDGFDIEMEICVDE